MEGDAESSNAQNPRKHVEHPGPIVTDGESSPSLELREEIDPEPRDILRHANDPHAVPLLCPNSPLAMSPITIHSPRSKSEAEKRGTVFSSILNLTATTMGLGMLSLPHAFAQTGVVAGVVLILCSAFLAHYSLTCLVTVARASGHYSFEGNAEFFFGRRGRVALNIVLVTLLYGACVSGLVVVQTLIPTTLRNLIGCSPGQCDTFLLGAPVIGAICMLIVGAFSLQDSMHNLRHISFVALGGLAYYFFALLVMFTQRSPPLVHSTVKNFGTPGECLMALPVMFSAYICQFNIFKVDIELKAEARQHINLIIRVTIFGIATVAYIVGGLLGYFIVGEDVSDNILEDFHSVPTTLAGGAMAITNLCKLPLLFIPLRQSVQEGLGTENQYALSVILALLIYAVSIVLGSLTKVLSITGITAGCAISFIFPGMLYHSYVRNFGQRTPSLLPTEGGLGLNETEEMVVVPEAKTRTALGVACFGCIISVVGLINIVLHWHKV